MGSHVVTGLLVKRETRFYSPAYKVQSWCSLAMHIDDENTLLTHYYYFANSKIYSAIIKKWQKTNEYAKPKDGRVKGYNPALVMQRIIQVLLSILNSKHDKLYFLQGSGNCSSSLQKLSDGTLLKSFS